MNIFIADIDQQTAVLTPEESWHCAKVLRYKPNDQIELIDGKGSFYKAVLTQVHEKKCVAAITEGPIHQVKHPYYLHVAIAPTKQIDRIEWMIEKAVEIGIDELSFIKCKNSERTVIKTDRIQKIVESAVKQSKQAFIPKVNELNEFKEICKTDVDHKFIAHCDEDEKLDIKNIKIQNASYLILVGPEGDFSPSEISEAKSAGFKPVSLGNTRLRTETAGLFVVQAFSILT
ncbi:MAG: 16S rRNA (uracil(1498)-N(3))-methyltransferase [Sphingobacteriaceae bacterium]